MKIFGFLLATLLWCQWCGFAEATPFVREFHVNGSQPGGRCPAAGDFPNPKNCTTFIHCGPTLAPNLTSCPVCEPDPVRCPEGRLYFDSEERKCTWADEAKCGPRPTTTTTSTTSTTTPSTTTADPGECVPDCIQTGECMCFDTCLRNETTGGGYWHKEWCDPDPITGEYTYWNPDANSIHGGTCDFWDNLSLAVQDYYRSLDDELCPTPGLNCYWKPHPTCDNWYLYLPEGSPNYSNELTLKCPVSPTNGDTMWWNQVLKTCTIACPQPPCNRC